MGGAHPAEPTHHPAPGARSACCSRDEPASGPHGCPAFDYEVSGEGVRSSATVLSEDEGRVAGPATVARRRSPGQLPRQAPVEVRSRGLPASSPDLRQRRASPSRRIPVEDYPALPAVPSRRPARSAARPSPPPSRQVAIAAGKRRHPAGPHRSPPRDRPASGSRSRPRTGTGSRCARCRGVRTTRRPTPPGRHSYRPEDPERMRPSPWVRRAAEVTIALGQRGRARPKGLDRGSRAGPGDGRRLAWWTASSPDYRSVAPGHLAADGRPSRCAPAWSSRPSEARVALVAEPQHSPVLLSLLGGR